MFCMKLFASKAQVKGDIKKVTRLPIKTVDISLQLVSNSKLEEVKKIIAQEKEDKKTEWINSKPIHQAIFLAIQQHRHDLLSWLIQEGILLEMELRIESKLSAIECAVYCNNVEALKLMLKHYTDFKSTIILKAMILAVGSCHVAACDYLLSRGVDPNGLMPIDNSRGKQQFSYLAAMIIDGAAVKKDLQSAIEEREQYKKMVQLLLQFGANEDHALEQIKMEFTEKEEGYHPRLRELARKHSDNKLKLYDDFFDEIKNECQQKSVKP